MRLSVTDIDRISACMEAMLDPFGYQDLDDWRVAVIRRMIAVVQADKGLFMLPLNGRADPLGLGYLPGTLDNYPRELGQVVQRYDHWNRFVAAGVGNRAIIWGEHLQEVLRSAYYNEYVVPARGFNTLGMARSLEPGAPQTDSTAQLVVHTEADRTDPFGDRGLEIFRLLYPSFVAGLNAFSQHYQHRSHFEQMLDAADASLLLFDRDGRIVHETSGFSRQAGSDPEAARIRECAASLAEGVRRLRNGDAEPGSTQPSVQLDTRSRTYRLRGCFVGLLLGREEDLVMISVQSPHPGGVHASTEDLKTRFGLTTQQARVALLLADRWSDREIADTLCISPNTVRRHIDEVLGKLGIHSRREVAGRVTQD